MREIRLSGLGGGRRRELFSIHILRGPLRDNGGNSRKALSLLQELFAVLPGSTHGFVPAAPPAGPLGSIPELAGAGALVRPAMRWHQRTCSCMASTETAVCASARVSSSISAIRALTTALSEGGSVR